MKKIESPKDKKELQRRIKMFNISYNVLNVDESG